MDLCSQIHNVVLFFKPKSLNSVTDMRTVPVTHAHVYFMVCCKEIMVSW